VSGGLLACALGALPGLGLAVAMAEGWISQRVGLALFALSYVGLNLAHFGATWARTYLEPGFAARRPVERVVVPSTPPVARRGSSARSSTSRSTTR
jgi:hypothetical protein